MADPVAKFLRRGTGAISGAWIPDEWWGWGFGLAGGYLGKELAVRYTPNLVNRLFIGSLVEPLVRKKMVSHVMPVSASLGAFSGLYVTISITNLMLRLFAKPTPGVS